MAMPVETFVRIGRSNSICAEKNLASVLFVTKDDKQDIVPRR